MEKTLLSVDWDYFINTQQNTMRSYAENKKTVIDLWYKRYLQSRARGKNIQKYFRLSLDVDKFWQKIKTIFKFDNGIKVYVSDSHALSYDIAKKNHCTAVYLFDAHADLGYGGLASLSFEVNCANWLGRLFKDKQIKKARIIYSPFTAEKPEYFQQLNSIYDIKYPALSDLAAGIPVSAVHICRSGAWTPPWYDQKFFQFVKALGIPYQIISCPIRKWNTDISTADKIYYLMA